jgi:hypothetical protein
MIKQLLCEDKPEVRNNFFTFSKKMELRIIILLTFLKYSNSILNVYSMYLKMFVIKRTVVFQL